MIDSSYSYTLKEIEKMDDARLQLLAAEQAVNLRHNTLQQTIKQLESILA